MQKILLISDMYDGDLDVCKMLETHLPYQVHATQGIAAARQLLESKVFNLVIIDLSEANHELLYFVDWIKNTSSNFPVLLIASKSPVATQTYTRLMHYHDMHILFKPTNEKHILGLVKKLLIAKKVPKQVFRRFNTNQIAHMEALSSGDSLLSSMYNLSKGGVYCEFDGANRVAVGDMFRMKIYLNDTNSEYTFNARVVWVTQKGRFSGRFGCGFKFVTAKDTYRNLRHF